AKITSWSCVGNFHIRGRIFSFSSLQGAARNGLCWQPPSDAVEHKRSGTRADRDCEYGERLEILDRFQDQLHVRTTNGLTGWITQGDLLTSEMWQKAKDLESETKTLPIEARGYTRALTNLHIAAGRESPRIRQLNKMVPVDLFKRQVVAFPLAPTAVSIKEADARVPTAKKE